ncbi:hypothetical protein EGW08_023257 [Elysia chlorotica]|uniref:Paraneoplastic antigen Ma-like C-terminal domain-containing protein n=1 Tax=Elysia chlorotica TaxID=188477 RepID=A0A433SIY1_ELYCH|nr:hypothetical protein EGW08_023257 [Elysia chlorotica]
MGVQTIQPRLPLFSGESKDTAFDLWRYEVECLRAEGKREADIRMAIRRSLKGQASRTLMTLGVGASVDDILRKFQSVFGPTETAQNILSRFYGLKQGQAEDAGSFAARLEDVILQAVQLGRVRREDVDAMLGFISAQASEVDALKTLVLELRTELRILKRDRAQHPPAGESGHSDHVTPVQRRHQYHVYVDQTGGRQGQGMISFVGAAACMVTCAPDVGSRKTARRLWVEADHRRSKFLPHQGEKCNDPAAALDFTSTAFSGQDYDKLTNLVTDYNDFMAQDEVDMGHYRGVEHTIELEDPKPFKQRYRRISPHMFDEVRDHLGQLRRVE